MSKQKIPLAGVIGDPISHSLSPKLHGHWLERYGISGRYVPLHVHETDLEDVLRTLPKMGFVGVNVTLPHKIRAMQIANQVTDRAILIGAANTLTFKEDGTIFADNTDGFGFIENIKQSAPSWVPGSGPAVVLGAGGAARAIIVALVEAGVSEIMLTNRTKPKAEALRAEFGPKVTVVDWVQAGNVIEGAGIVINTTSLGMSGQPELRVPLDGLRPGTVVNDIVYTPLETQFLSAARAAGCTVVDGLGMLLHQGVPGFERWFGQRPLVDEELRQVILS